MTHLVQPVFFLLQEQAAENQNWWQTLVHSNVLNFLIAAAFLVWIFCRYNLLSYLDNSQLKVIQELKDAEEKRAKALTDLEEIEKRTAQLVQEVDSIIQDAHHTAELVGQSLVKNAEEEAKKILENAQKRIALEEKTIARDLEHRLMQEAIYSAKQLLETTLTEEDKHRSIESFVTLLPDLYAQEVKH